MRFTELLGDKITLRGWDRFKGGLDVKSKQCTACLLHCLFNACNYTTIIAKSKFSVNCTDYK